MKNLFNLLLVSLTLSCTKQELKPQICYECSYTRVTSWPLRLDWKPEYRIASFTDCGVLEELHIKYNYTSESANTKIVQTTKCTLKN